MTSSATSRRKGSAPSASGALLGYARVSTTDQNPQLQIDALERAGVAKIYVDHASGTKSSRPQWDALLRYARDGDTIVVWRLDRAGRSLRNLIELSAELEQRGIRLKLIHEAIDTTTASGRLIFQVMGVLAEFERNLLSERTKAGHAAARARGHSGGRRPKLTPTQIRAARSMCDSRKHTVREIAESLGVPRHHLPGARPSRARQEDGWCITASRPGAETEGLSVAEVGSLSAASLEA